MVLIKMIIVKLFLSNKDQIRGKEGRKLRIRLEIITPFCFVFWGAGGGTKQ